MAKVLLDYDPDTGWIRDPSGLDIYNIFGLPVYTEPEPTPVDLTIIQLIDLKAAGYSVSDLADMKRAGLL
jgi:hypothetical protein